MAKRLYRPVGNREMMKITDSGMKKFPPRLAHQPIFYPVLTREYAVHIAEKWNTKDSVSDHVGIVTTFEVNEEFLSRYETHKVGKDAEEYWIPAEDLEEFNRNIVGRIEVIATFLGNPITPSSGSDS